MMRPRPVHYKLYVIFTGTGRMAMLDQYINHVYAIKETELFWIKTEKYWTHIDTEIWPVLGNPHIRCIVGEEPVVVPVEVNINPIHVRWAWDIFSCVGVVKAQLGLVKPWILTPMQLYRYLTKET